MLGTGEVEGAGEDMKNSSSRFQVARVDSQSDRRGSGDNYGDVEPDSPQSGPASSGCARFSISSLNFTYDTANKTCGWRNTHEAIPSEDHYRNIFSATAGLKSRPTLAELHEVIAGYFTEEKIKPGGTEVEEGPPSSAKVEGTKEADPPDNGLETTFVNTGDSVLQTGGVTVAYEGGPPSSAKDGGTKEADPPDIGLATAFIDTCDIVLQTDVYFCKKRNNFSLLLIISLMIFGCSAMPSPPASCSAGISAVGEPTSVTCLFGRNILTSSHGVSVQMFPFNSTKIVPGKDALVCSWQKNAPDCFVEDGYSFNNNISDRLILQIHAATPEIAGVYKCHVASDDSPPSACNLTVTERQGSTPVPTTTNGTTGKAMSTAAEPSETMGLGDEVIAFIISLSVLLIGVAAVSAVVHLCLYRRFKSSLAEKNTSEKAMGKEKEKRALL